MDEDEDDKALDKLTSLEELDQSLVVVRIRGWILLVFFSLLVIAIGSWSFFGTLPISVTGKCLVFDLENAYQLQAPTEGIIKEIRYRSGEKVEKGTVLVTFDNPPSEVVAPANGEVLWVNGKEGLKPDLNYELVGFQGDGTVKDLTIIGFLPMRAGFEVVPGMTAHASIDKATPEKYGMMVAKVTRVDPFPVGPEQSTIQKIPSKALVNYLIDGDRGPKIMVLCKPVINPHNPSQLEWTSEDGPPYMIFPGAVGNLQITLENVKPITYVLPKK